jgi:predicted transcriptional regulator
MVDGFNFVTDNDLRREIRAMLKESSQGQVAKRLCISQTQLSQFLDRSRPHASYPLLKKMGCDSTRYYRRNGG